MIRTSLDTFTPMGPTWSPLTRWVRGSARTALIGGGCAAAARPGANLIRYVPGLLSYASSALRLLPGDVVSTGTLAGAGEVRDGQRIVVDIGPVDRLAEPPRRRRLRRRR
ncbi:fumarylacetoacetate hydrolase family protein [Streptomyces sp. HUAS ZL42]|uniref:fumarylacetoacetate hydrolase family protein n=1 Tax=Streptomyces sp. HUAS ZL42 TaxID=3231715 RepID=UPI00345E7B00